MAKYTAQIQPDYFNDNYKIVVWSNSDLSLIEDLLRALKSLGEITVTDGEFLKEDWHYYLQTKHGDIRLRFETKSLGVKQEAYTLTCHGNNDLVYQVVGALDTHSNFHVKDEMKHPFLEPFTSEGYAFLAVAFVLLILIFMFGKPDFEAHIRGLPLALLAFAGASVLVVKFSGIRFLINRINEKFPDPVNLNGLALGYAVTLGFVLLVFL